MCDVHVHLVNRRLARNLDGLLPGVDLLGSAHVIITLALQTRHRQTAMSSSMLEERKERQAELVERMKCFVAHFDARDVWCDFIDPFTGAPFKTDSPTVLADCDERYRSLGFTILELGCCKALCNDKFGQCLVMTSAFVRASEEEVAKGLPILEQAVSGEQSALITGEQATPTTFGATEFASHTPITCYAEQQRLPRDHRQANRKDDSPTSLFLMENANVGTGILVLLGGVIGYAKKKSKVSLIAGVLSGGFLVASGRAKSPKCGFFVSVLLLGIMGSRFKKDGKVMPAGMVTVLSLFTGLVNVKEMLKE